MSNWWEADSVPQVPPPSNWWEDDSEDSARNTRAEAAVEKILPPALTDEEMRSLPVEAIESRAVSRSLGRVALTRGGKIGDIASEVLPAVAGSIAGIPGGAVGVAAGGAAGAAAGNALKQAREMVRGERESIGKGELAVSALTGALPLGKVQAASTAVKTAAKIVGARAAQGAAVAGAGEAARQWWDDDKLDAGTIAKAAVIGGGLGAIMGGFEGAVVARRMVRTQGPSGMVEMPSDSLPAAEALASSEPSPSGAAPAAAAALQVPPGPGVPQAESAKPLGLITSAKSSPDIAPPLRTALQAFYEPLTNSESIAAANAKLDSLGSLDGAKAHFLGNSNPDAVSNAMGLELVRKYQAEGRLGDAADVLYDMAKKAKTQGQAIQILSTLSRGTPEGMVNYAQKLLDRKLTAAELAEIEAGMARVAAAKEPEVKLARQADLLDAINSKAPLSLGEKLAAAQNISLLLNPKTLVRNLAGNVLMAVPEAAADTIIPAVDFGVSIFTGERTARGPQMLDYLSGLGQPLRDAKLGYQQARSEGRNVRGALAEGLRTMATLAKLTSAGSLQLTDINRAYRTVFSNPLAQAMEKTLSITLGVPDRAFYTARLKASLRDQMKAAAAIAPTAEMVDRASMEAARAIYQDPNHVSRQLGRMKKWLNESVPFPSKQFGLGQIVMPFTQVPGSLLMRGIEYSPVGFVKAAYDVLPQRLTGRAFDQRGFAQDFSRALLGTTALTATGYWLSKLGIISGAPDLDRDVEALRRKMGVGGYRINASELKRRLQSMDWTTPSQASPAVGDVYVNYDWAQPVAFPVAMGADFAESSKRNRQLAAKGKYVRTTNDVLQAVISGARTIEEQPMLTGLTGFFTAAANAQRGQGAGALDAIYQSMLQLPGVYVPSVVRNMQQFMDNRVYETRGTNKLETSFQQIAANVPKLAEALGYKPRHDVLGDLAARYQADGNSAFNVFINPAFVSHVVADPQTRELYGIWQRTAEGRQMPRMVDQKITINDRPKILTGPEVADYQQFVGRVTRDGFRELMSSTSYAKAADGERAKVLARIVGSADQAARVLMFGDRPKSLDQFDRALLGMALKDREARPLIKTTP